MSQTCSFFLKFRSPHHHHCVHGTCPHPQILQTQNPPRWRAELSKDQRLKSGMSQWTATAQWRSSKTSLMTSLHLRHLQHLSSGRTNDVEHGEESSHNYTAHCPAENGGHCFNGYYGNALSHDLKSCVAWRFLCLRSTCPWLTIRWYRGLFQHDNEPNTGNKAVAS